MEVEELMKQLSEGGINIQGDFVMKKEVEYEINNVEPGGIGMYFAGKDGAAGTKTDDSPLIQELLPVFQNVRSEVVNFIKAIDGQKPIAITEQVNNLVKQGKILKANSQKDLWSILHNYKLYKPSFQNWNLQVN